MPNDSSPADSSRLDRRTLLQILGAASALGTTATVGASTAADDDTDPADAGRTFVFEQGDDRYEVTPLSGDETVEQFYDLRIPDRYGGDNGATDPGEGPYFTSVGTEYLQQPDASILFFYDGPNGLSLVAVHEGKGVDGGAVSWVLSDVPENAEWLVKDDYYLDSDGEELNFDNWKTDGTTHVVDWTWRGGRSDGGALGYLGGNTTVRIDPAFNDAAELSGGLIPYEGEVREWQVLSAGDDGVDRFQLALDETVTASVETTDLPFDLSVAPPDGKINLASEGLITAQFECPDATAIDVGSIRFGPPEAVDEGDGATPEHDGHDADGVCTFHFGVGEAGFDPTDDVAKLTGEVEDDEGVTATFTLTATVEVFDPRGDEGRGRDDRDDDREDDQEDRQPDEDENGDEEPADGETDEEGDEEETEDGGRGEDTDEDEEDEKEERSEDGAESDEEDDEQDENGAEEENRDEKDGDEEDEDDGEDDNEEDDDDDDDEGDEDDGDDEEDEEDGDDEEDEEDEDDEDDDDDEEDDEDESEGSGQGRGRGKP